MSGDTENTADTSIELLHTTIDAVGLDTGFNSGSIAMIPFMAGLIPSLIFLAITCSALVGLVARNWQEARHHGKYAAVLAALRAGASSAVSSGVFAGCMVFQCPFGRE